MGIYNLKKIILFLLLVSIGACGLKAPIDRPDGASYPRSYPQG